jgi:hypothetical protein
MVAAVIALGATVVSTILAGVGGMLTVTVTHDVSASSGLEMTALALGVALLGGTSAFGRRGGIFGTVLAVGLLTVVDAYGRATGRDWSIAAMAAIAVGIGLVVTRLVERFGRPEPARDEDTDEQDWAPKVHAAAPGAWQAAPSTATTTTPGGLWASDEAWGSSDRR